MRLLLAGLLVTWALVAGATEPSPPVAELQLNAEQLKDYYAVYENDDVRYLRRVFDRALAGKPGKEEEACAEYTDYLSHRFVVISRDPAIGGGTEIYLLFQGKTDRMFRAWIYPVGADRTLELRHFLPVDIPEEKLARMRIRYKRFLEDAAHAM